MASQLVPDHILDFYVCVYYEAKIRHICAEYRTFNTTIYNDFLFLRCGLCLWI